MKALEAEIEAGNVNKQVHPTLPLAIYKYSKVCVFTSHWNEITLRCRGVVLDETGEIIINGFPKFFNHNQAECASEYAKRKESSMAYEVTDKMDGSLIQVARYRGQVVVASSGSFTSPQALKATELLTSRFNEIMEHYSYLFELIYPENRIVLNYGDMTSLVLLAIRETETGFEIDRGLHPSILNKVAVVNGRTLEEIEKDLKRDAFINKEGFIIKFSDGFRVKLKYDEYCRLHKIVSGVNEKYVWECLRDNVDIETQLVNVPDELYQFVRDAKAKFQAEYDGLDNAAKLIFYTINKEATRKEQAEFILRHYKEYAKILFMMLDGRDYSKLIWNAIEPEFKPGIMGMGEA